MTSLSVLLMAILTGARSTLDPRPSRSGFWSCDPLAEGKIAIALEQRRGALFFQLCTHLGWINLYAINPHSLASFRKTFFSSRAKDDPVDSQLLEELVRTHPERFRPYQPEPTAERKLDQYCLQRRSLRDLATKTELKLISTLKQYFPLAVNLFDGMKSDIALNFLSRWPTLDELRRAKAQTVRSFFCAHNSRSQSSGNKADISFAEELTECLPKDSTLIGDKAYDSSTLRETATAKGVKTCIPGRANRTTAVPFSAKLYRRRHRVENFFQRIKRHRRVATRYDKLAETFLGFVCLAIVLTR
jgi:transposase